MRNSNLSANKQLHQAIKNLTAAIKELGKEEGVSNKNIPLMREAILKLQRSLNIITDNISELDSESFNELQDFLGNAENKATLNKAITENPILNTMPTTQEKILSQLNNIYNLDSDFLFYHKLIFHNNF